MPKISLKTPNFQPHIYPVRAFWLREEKKQGIIIIIIWNKWKNPMQRKTPTGGFSYVKRKMELGSYHFIGSSKDLGWHQPIMLLGCVHGTYK